VHAAPPYPHTKCIVKAFPTMQVSLQDVQKCMGSQPLAAVACWCKGRAGSCSPDIADHYSPDLGMQEWVGQQLAGGLAAADEVADQLPAGAAELVQQRRGRRPLRLVCAVPPEGRDVVLEHLARAGCAAALGRWPGPGMLSHVRFWEPAHLQPMHPAAAAGFVAACAGAPRHITLLHAVWHRELSTNM